MDWRSFHRFWRFNMRRVGLIAVAACFLLGADEPKQSESKKDAEALQGSWKLTSVERNGEEISADFLQSAKLVVKGERYSVTAGDQSAVATFKMDASRRPKQIDFTYIEGPQKGETIQGIYEVEGDTYRMCRGLTSGTERPTKFAAPADSGLIFVIMKREKAKSANGDGAQAKASNGSRSAAAEAELKRFEGTWLYLEVVTDGKPVPEESFKGSRLVLAGEEFTLKESDATYRGTYTVDPTVKPKTLDVTFSDGPEAGKTIKGIYDLTGDRCKVCIALGDQPRPTEFASPPGGGYALEVLKRAKP
jgi:uncharacterized protein (TIGR03067 family)